MLNNKNIIKETVLSFVTLLIFISIITFHSDALAGSKKKLYEQYRDSGYTEQKKGNLNEALTYFSKAVALGFEDPKVFNDMGVIYERIGFFSKAEKYYGLSIQADNTYLPAYSNMALMYLNHGYPEQAFPYFKKRFELSELGDPWGERAKEELLKIKPEFHVWTVRVDADKLNDQIVQQNHQQFIATVQRANEHYLKGVKHVKKQELRNALHEFDQALTLTPDNPKIINARKDVIKELTNRQIRRRTDIAIQQLNAGDSYSAKRELQKILSNFPDESLLKSR